jgi:hypothetical protein
MTVSSTLAVDLYGKSALATFTGLQTIATSSGIPIPFTTLSDNDLGATIVGNEIIIPTGVTKIVIFGGAEGNGGTSGFFSIIIMKNGSPVPGCPAHAHPVTSSAGFLQLSAVSAPISVVAGDAIKLQAFNGTNATATLDGDTACFLSVMAIG